MPGTPARPGMQRGKEGRRTTSCIPPLDHPEKLFRFFLKRARQTFGPARALEIKPGKDAMNDRHAAASMSMI